MNEMCKWGFVFFCVMFIAGLTSAPLLAHSSGKVVLFDQSHGQRFLLESDEPLGLSVLGASLTAAGLTTKTLPEEITSKALRDVSGLMISGPFQGFSAAEIEAVKAFLNRGGRLCLTLHISLPVLTLLKELGVAVSHAPVRDKVNLIAGNALDFKVSTLEKHSLTIGMDGFSVYGCWGLINLDSNSKVLAATSPEGWSDMNGDGHQGPAEPNMTLGVLVAGTLGKGEFVIIGDDAVFQNKFLTGGNLRLADNISAWLKGGTDN